MKTKKRLHILPKKKKKNHKTSQHCKSPVVPTCQKTSTWVTLWHVPGAMLMDCSVLF